MNIKIISIFFFFFVHSFVYGQSKTLVRLDILAPGISLENKILSNSTISTHVSWHIGSLFSSANYSYIGAMPYASVKYNYYLNIEKRSARGVNTFSNSGNYLSVGVNYIISSAAIKLYYNNPNSNIGNSPNNMFAIPLGFGIQRAIINNKFYYNFLFGAYIVPNQRSNIFPHLHFRLGYTLFNK